MVGKRDARLAARLAAQLAAQLAAHLGLESMKERKSGSNARRAPGARIPLPARPLADRTAGCTAPHRCMSSGLAACSAILSAASPLQRRTNFVQGAARSAARQTISQAASAATSNALLKTALRCGPVVAVRSQLEFRSATQLVCKTASSREEECSPRKEMCALVSLFTSMLLFSKRSVSHKH
jgi:hypothetical protein